jgi:hypothetical protein
MLIRRPNWRFGSVPVRAQGHVEQQEQADRDGVKDKASHALSSAQAG